MITFKTFFGSSIGRKGNIAKNLKLAFKDRFQITFKLPAGKSTDVLSFFGDLTTMPIVGLFGCIFELRNKEGKLVARSFNRIFFFVNEDGAIPPAKTPMPFFGGSYGDNRPPLVWLKSGESYTLDIIQDKQGSNLVPLRVYTEGFKENKFEPVASTNLESRMSAMEDLLLRVAEKTGVDI